MRLIDADALLEYIKNIPTWWADDGGEYGPARKYPDALFYPEDIVSAIECAPTIEPTSKWMDIKDYPPLPDEDILMLFEGGDIVSGFCEFDKFDGEVHWYAYTGDHFYTEADGIPVRWMPCPIGANEELKR